MAKVTLNTVMSDWKKFAESKRASEHERLAGASIPGGERNSAKEVPAESPEVKDKKVAPTANRENTPGAESTKLAPGVEALPTVGAGVAVEAKPLIDPNPTLDKQAERVTELANAILAGIVTHNQKTAEANKDSAKEKVTVEGPGKSEKAVEAAPKGSGPAVVKTYAKSTTAPAAVPAAAKEANDLNMDLTTEVLAKIAAIVCSTEDGAAFVQAKLDAAIGAEKTAEINAYMSKQAELYDSQVYNAQAEYEAGVKYAEQIMNDPMFKLGQEMGMASLGADPEGMPAGLPEGGLPPEALDEPMPEAGGLGGEESITPEDIVGALQDMVTEGEIDAETATQLMQELMGGAEGGAPEGAPAEEGVPVEEAPAPTPEHEASETPAEEEKEEASADESREKEAALKTLSAIFKKAEAHRRK